MNADRLAAPTSVNTRPTGAARVPEPAAHPQVTDEMAALLAASGLPALRLAGRTVLPIVQGGMGVGVSAHRLAGAVAAQGAIGTLASVDLRRHHPDLMARTGHLPAAGAGPLIDAANLEALDREIRAARALAGGRGLIQCGLRDGIGRFGQFCIDRQLAAAMNGDVATGLFFRAAGRLPFGSAIRPVGDLLRLLLGAAPVRAPA